MNSLSVILLTFFIFSLGYIFYSRRIEKLLGVDPNRKTPAHANYDGIDFVPAKHWTVLFGHHFASIAGAAPVIGPIIAVSIWGWAPTLFWVILGTVFIGGVHDFGSLMISVKHRGNSIADIAKDAVSGNAKIVFLLFVWCTLILIISVFVYLCAKTFVVSPEIVIPSLGLIPVAILVGFLLYNLKLHQPTVTILGLLSLAILIFVGNYIPIVISQDAVKIWSIVLLIYCFIASVTPVQLLLQPRDYLSSFLLFFGLFLGYLGLIFFDHSIKLAPVLRHAVPEALPMWPVLFVTVACGAVSGFHSIVASGTTSKQISNEKEARKIGYGGMVAEGMVAAMTVLVVVVAFKDNLSLSDAVNKGAGPVGAFAVAYGVVTKKFLGGYGALFATTLLNAFILTTLDTATRIGRYLTQELFKIKNRFAATLIVVALSGWLGLSGEWNEIWPIFGSANQLIAALSLIVVTSWLLSRGKKVIYTLLPALFMLATTIGALIMKIMEYAGKKEILLFIISFILLILAIFILVEAFNETMRILKKRIKHKEE